MPDASVIVVVGVAAVIGIEVGNAASRLCVSANHAMAMGLVRGRGGVDVVGLCVASWLVVNVVVSVAVLRRLGSGSAIALTTISALSIRVEARAGVLGGNVSGHRVQRLGSRLRWNDRDVAMASGRVMVVLGLLLIVLSSAVCVNWVVGVERGHLDSLGSLMVVLLSLMNRVVVGHGGGNRSVSASNGGHGPVDSSLGLILWVVDCL